MTASVVTAAAIPVANAAPPVSVIAEELGYFPITKTSSSGETVRIMVPKRISRTSSTQAIRLAEFLKTKDTTVFTAYWCPHCARQRELFGREAWAILRNVECSPGGYQANPAICLKNQVDGYPTWKIGKQVIGGERDLADIAKAVGFVGFDPALEENVPPPLGSSQCRQ